MPEPPDRQLPRRGAGPRVRTDATPAEAHEWRTRRHGIFEGLPRLAFRRTGRRYIDACAAGTVLHGVAVAGFGLLMLTLYVDLSLDPPMRWGREGAAVAAEYSGVIAW